MLSKDLCYKAPCTPATSQPWVYLLLSLIQKLGTLIYNQKILLPPELHLKPLLNYINSENQGMCITTADCTHKCPRNMPTKPVSHRRASPQTQRCHMQHCLPCSHIQIFSNSDITPINWISLIQPHFKESHLFSFSCTSIPHIYPTNKILFRHKGTLAF